ncbi:MAG: hypothetical protein EP335_00320 [Alphaproteobacteria bacterium]|nr:MAG: hypothetical protein EP335_00320 [Alphaproteobacteria bacterium]
MTMASLSASLLARKGQARPTAASQPVNVEDIFSRHRAAIPTYKAKVMPKPAKGGKRTAKTLRLEADLNHRLRLLAAYIGVTQQSLMEKAVRTLLASELPEGSQITLPGKKTSR